MGLLDKLRSEPVADPAQEGEKPNFAPAWRWEKSGDSVGGVVLSVDTRINDNNPEGYPIVTIRQEDGTDIAIHGFATVLKGKIVEAGLRPGDEFAAIYDGKKTGGAGRQYHDFRTLHEQGQGGAVPVAAPQAQAAPAGNPWDGQATEDIPPF
jgi:hypothetical protein